MTTHESNRSPGLQQGLVYLFLVSSGVVAILFVDRHGAAHFTTVESLAGGIVGFGIGYYSVFVTENERFDDYDSLRSRALGAVAMLCLIFAISVLTVFVPIAFWSGVATMAVGHLVGWFDYYP